MQTMQRLNTAYAFSMSLLLLLAACGGGGSGGDLPQSPPANPVSKIEATVPAQGLTFVGEVGNTGAVRQFVVKNTGNVNVTMAPTFIEGADYTGAGSTPGECNDQTTLAPGASCTVGIAFKPQKFGVTSRAITIGTRNNAAPQQQFQLEGTAYPSKPAPTGQPVTLAGARIDPATNATVVPVLPDGRTSATLRHWYPWSDYRSTGIYAKPGEVISVAVGAAPAGTTVQALIGIWQQKTAVGGALDTDPTVVALTPNTTNNISTPYGGPVYVRAVNPVKGGTVRFQVTQGGTKMPIFLLGRDTHAQWIAAVNASDAAPYVEVVSNRAILTFPTDRVKAALSGDPTADIAGIAALYDEMLASHDGVAGLDGSSATDQRSEHPLHYTPQEVPNYYMFAFNYRTAYCVSDCAQFLFTKKLMSDGWGPWHETGHMYQGLWEWRALVEVSVNLYSLEFESKMGARNRLLREDSSVAGVNHWDRALQLRPTLTSFEQLDVFERLVMFWQLRLAYGPSFYASLHKLYRNPAMRPTTLSDDESFRQTFIVSASRVAGRDLRAYFSAWGLRATPAVDTQVQALGLPPADVNALLQLRPSF